jgi:mono/diheme cytochrome c family protein
VPRDLARRSVAALAAAALLAACATRTPPPSAASIYATELRPLLQQRCGRCHFPGGKMHRRLPFDDPATLDELGAERLFTRIEDDAGRALVDAYFAARARERPAP